MLPQANVSKHLQVLYEAGFVDRRKDGLFAYYRIADERVLVLCEVMCDRLRAEAERRYVALAGGFRPCQRGGQLSASPAAGA
jgi:DNA-binding transcriptional ArsR family regulator